MVDLTPVDYLGGLGGLAGIPNFTNMLAKSQALRTSEVQQQAAQLQIQKALTEQQQQQLFQRDVMTLGDNPTPQGIAALIRRYPQFAEQLKSAHDIQDEAKRTSDFRLQSQVYSAAANGRYDLAAQMLEDYANADIAAGGAADPMDQAIIEALRSDDPAEQKRALSMIGIAVAAINPKKFDETYKALTGGAESYTLAPGSMRFDSGNRLVASAPFAPEYRNVSPGDTVVEIDRNSAGTAAGDSATAALNNPGAIRFDPSNKWQGQIGNANGFVKFDTPENGQRAHRKLIANQIKAGFDTPLQWASRYAPAGDGNNDPQAYAKAVADGLGIGINDKIPLSAVPKMADISARVEGMGASGGSGGAGGARVVAVGPPKPGYRVLTPDEVSRVKGLDPARAYQISPDGQITAIGGNDRGQLKPWPATQAAAHASNRAALKNIDGAIDLFQPNVKPNDNSPEAKRKRREAAIANKAIGFGTGLLGDRVTQWNDPEGTDARARIGQIGGLIIKDTSGAAVSLSEDQRLAKWVPLVTDSPKVAIAKLKNLKRELAQRNQTLEETFSEDQGYRPLGGAASSPGGFRIISVRPK